MTLLTKQQIEALRDGTTPGPWLREAQGIYADNGHKLIASVKSHVHGIAWPTTEANGNIMAAAPDLMDTALDALARLEALAALRAERDRINQWRETAIVERDTYSEERDDALARLAAAEAQVTALRLQLDQKDALYDSGFQAGVKLGWNFGVSGDEVRFQAATASTDHVAELERIRAALATVTPPADTIGGQK